MGRFRSLPTREGVALAALVGALSVFLVLNGTRTFDFFDMSQFIAAAWRMVRGESPYADFYFHAGPVHLAMHAFFFHLFGFTRLAVMAHLVVVNAIFTTVTFYILRRHVGFRGTLALTALASLAFYGPSSHPWYDQNADMWLVAGLGLHELHLRVGSRASARVAGFGGGVAVVLAFAIKQNIGAAGFGVFLVLMLAGPHRRAALLAYLYGLALMLSVIVYVLADPYAYYFDAFRIFKTGKRLRDLARLRELLLVNPATLITVPALAYFLSQGRAFVRDNLPRLAVFVGLALIAWFGSWTGTMLPTGNMMLTGLQAGYVFVLLAQIPAGASVGISTRHATRVAAGIALFVALVAARRTRDLEAWRWRPWPGYVRSDYALQTAAFRGWRCDGRIGEGVDRAVEFIAAHVPKDESLFVFPDSQIIYGLSGHDTYRGAPAVFDLFKMPPEGKPRVDFRLRFLRSPPQWFLMHQQTEIWWLRWELLLKWLVLDDFMYDHYEEVWRSGEYHMLHLKPATAAPSGPADRARTAPAAD